MDHILGRALERHLPLNPFGDQLHLVLDVRLEIAVGAPPRHGTDAAHAAIALIGPPLIEEGFARCLGGACQQRSDHDATGASRQRLGHVAARAQPAIGDHRHAQLGGGFGRIHDRGQLRHAHARDNARGADRPRPDANLHAIRARADQRARCLGSGDIARDHLDMVGQALDRFYRSRNLLAVAMGGIDDDQVAFRVDQRLAALQPLVAHRGRRRDAQAA